MGLKVGFRVMIELGRGLFSPPDAPRYRFRLSDGSGFWVGPGAFQPTRRPECLVRVWGLGLRVSRPGKLISEIHINYI